MKTIKKIESSKNKLIREQAYTRLISKESQTKQTIATGGNGLIVKYL